MPRATRRTFELNQAVYSQRDATFRGGEFQFQWDTLAMWSGFWGVDGQYDIVRATFADGTNVPRIPPLRVGGGVYFRNAEWLGRISLLHAFAQNDIAIVGETPTAGYNLLKVEISHTRELKNDPTGIKKITVGVVGNNLLNDDIRNSVSYTKDQVLMPGASVRLFASVKDRPRALCRLPVGAWKGGDVGSWHVASFRCAAIVWSLLEA